MQIGTKKTLKKMRHFLKSATFVIIVFVIFLIRTLIVTTQCVFLSVSGSYITG